MEGPWHGTAGEAQSLPCARVARLSPPFPWHPAAPTEQSLCEVARSPLAPVLANDAENASRLLSRLFRLCGDAAVGRRLWRSNEFVYDAATTLVLALAQPPMQRLLSDEAVSGGSGGRGHKQQRRRASVRRQLCRRQFPLLPLPFAVAAWFAAVADADSLPALV